MRQRTQLINALRAHLAEFGITAAQGREGIKELLAVVAQDEGSRFALAGRRLFDRAVILRRSVVVGKNGAGSRTGASRVPNVGGGNPCDQVIMSLRRRLSSNAADADSSIPSVAVAPSAPILRSARQASRRSRRN